LTRPEIHGKKRRTTYGRKNPKMARVPWNKGKHNVYSKAILKKMSRGQFIRFQNGPHPNLGRVIPEDQKTQFRKTEVLLLRHF
jgi:hypothetical protein